MKQQLLDNIVRVKVNFSNFFRPQTLNSNNKTKNTFNGPVYFIGKSIKPKSLGIVTRRFLSQ